MPGEASHAVPAADDTCRRLEISTVLLRGRSGARAASAPPSGRPAKLAQLLATAHYIERLIHTGRVEHRAAAARALGLSRARVTQLLDLTLLAPDIQREILFAEAVDGVEPFCERDVRPIVREWEWAVQRTLWRRARAPAPPQRL